MRIEKSEIRAGDVIVFKGEGYIFRLCSLLFSVLDSSWRKRDWKPWHVAFLTQMDSIICEATAKGVVLTPLFKYEGKEWRCYRWFSESPRDIDIARFLGYYYGKKYDVLLYFWTLVQYIFRHYWNRPIPRLLDDRFTCWELVASFAEDMGKPLQSKYDCPTLPDILNALEV